MNDYPLPTEWRGMPAPDRADDPIGYACWFEANLCKWCDGSGEVWAGGSPEDEDFVDGFEECDECNGRGHFAPEEFDVDFA